MAFPEAAVLQDDFNRANGTVQSGAGAAFWSPEGINSGTNQLNVASNALIASGGNGRTLNKFGPDVHQWIEVPTLMGSSEGYVFFSARATTGGTWGGYGGIFIRTGASTYVHQLRKYTSGASSVLGGTASTKALVAGDALGFSVEGKILKLWRKPSGGAWEELASREDGTYTAEGYTGIETTATTVLDNYNVGTVSAGGPALIVAPAAAAIAAAPVPVPIVAPGAFVAQAVAGTAIPTPIVKPVAPAGAAEARGGVPAPEVRPAAPAAAAVASTVAPTPAIKPAPPAGAAEARGPAPVPVIRVGATAGAAVAASTPPSPAVRIVSAAAGAVAGALAPIPAMRVAAPVGAAVAAGLAPIINTAAVLIPSYWQARARILLGAARARFLGSRAAATITPTPTPAAVFEATPAARAVFADATPEAKFASGRPRADIGDPDQTATIVT